MMLRIVGLVLSLACIACFFVGLTAQYPGGQGGTIIPQATRTPRGGGSGQIVFEARLEGDDRAGLHMLTLPDIDIERVFMPGQSQSIQSAEWSPDGQRIAVGFYHMGLTDVAVMDADGRNFQNLTNTPSRRNGLYFSPAWSPDGQSIAYVGEESENWDIYTIQHDGSNPQRLTNTLTAEGCPAWSPDGQHIAFAWTLDRNTEIYIMERDGSNIQPLNYLDGEEYCLEWSPDGQHIAFLSNRDGVEEIYVMATDEGQPRRLTYDGLYKDEFSFSPDGQFIAYTSCQDPLQQCDLYMIAIDGGYPRLLFEGVGGFSSVAWRP